MGVQTGAVTAVRFANTRIGECRRIEGSKHLRRGCRAVNFRPELLQSVRVKANLSCQDSHGRYSTLLHLSLCWNNAETGFRVATSYTLSVCWTFLHLFGKVGKKLFSEVEDTLEVIYVIGVFSL